MFFHQFLYGKKSTVYHHLLFSSFRLTYSFFLRNRSGCKIVFKKIFGQWVLSLQCLFVICYYCSCFLFFYLFNLIRCKSCNNQLASKSWKRIAFGCLFQISAIPFFSYSRSVMI